MSAQPPPLCVICPLTGIWTHPPFNQYSSFFFNLEFHCDRISWTFYVSFSCAADVLQEPRAKRTEKGRSGSPLSRPMKMQQSTSSHSSVFSFLFMLTHVCSLPLCCIPKVTAGFCHCGSCPQAVGRMDLLSLEVCDQRPSVPIDSDQTSLACFFDELCLFWLALVALHLNQS